jgi:hypothetical protein
MDMVFKAIVDQKIITFVQRLDEYKINLNKIHIYKKLYFYRSFIARRASGTIPAEPRDYLTALCETYCYATLYYNEN